MMSTTIDGRSPVVDAAEIDAIHTGHTHEDAQGPDPRKVDTVG